VNGLEEFALKSEDLKLNLAFKCKSLLVFAKNNMDYMKKNGVENP
jgi:hypothetical protein